jgi:glycosyltransferase involved in cell wall biosynthesis
MEKITVIIPTYNRPQFLKECLDSMLAQTLKPYQIIVVNNGSPLETRKVCEAYKGIEYYEIESKGKSHASNFGLKLTKGDYVWIFDDDDIAMPDALERLVKSLTPGYDFSYSCSWKVENDDFDHPKGKSRIPKMKENEFFNVLLKANFISGACLFTRTKCYQEVGDYNTELVRSQDYDMAIRIARKFKGVRVDAPTFYYRQHPQPRGFGKQTFPAKDMRTKWLEYDQLIFKKLYNELELYEYSASKGSDS